MLSNGYYTNSYHLNLKMISFKIRCCSVLKFWISESADKFFSVTGTPPLHLACRAGPTQAAQTGTSTTVPSHESTSMTPSQSGPTDTADWSIAPTTKRPRGTRLAGRCGTPTTTTSTYWRRAVWGSWCVPWGAPYLTGTGCISGLLFAIRLGKSSRVNSVLRSLAKI